MLEAELGNVYNHPGDACSEGMKESWKAVEVWHCVVGSESQKRAQERLLVRVQPSYSGELSILKIPRYPCHGMTTRDSSSCRVELA